MGITDPYYNARIAGGLAAAAAQMYSGSRTNTVMRPPPGGPVAIEVGEYTRSRKTTGRYKRKTLRRAHQLLRIGLQKCQLRFQGVNQWNTRGFFPMFNYQKTDNLNYFFPIYLFDLTSFLNAAAGPTLDLAIPMYNLTSFGSGTGTNIVWSPQGGTGGDGSTTTTTWSIENVPGAFASTTNTPLRRSISKWIDIRMMMYGSTTTPTKWRVDLVQFTSPQYDPLYLQFLNSVTTPAPTLGPDDQATQVAFHQWLLNAYTYNPIMVQDPLFAKRIRFLKTYSCVIQPQESTETANATGHMRELRWFMKTDEVRRYDWNDSAVVSGIQNPLTGDAFQQAAQQGQNNVEWKLRKYLMIRATSPLRTGTTVPGVTATDPTFDLIVRNNHLIPI